MNVIREYNSHIFDESSCTDKHYVINEHYVIEIRIKLDNKNFYVYFEWEPKQYSDEFFPYCKIWRDNTKIIKSLQDIFDKLNEDKRNYVSPKDFIEMLNSLGFKRYTRKTVN